MNTHVLEHIHFTGIQHVWTMPNCYVSVVFERQPNPNEAVEAKEGGKKKARIEHKKRRSEEQEKRYMCIHYLSLSVVTIIWILFLLQKEVGQKTKKLSILMVMTMMFRTPSRVTTVYTRGYCSSSYTTYNSYTRWSRHYFGWKTLQVWFHNTPMNFSPWLSTEED